MRFAAVAAAITQGAGLGLADIFIFFGGVGGKGGHAVQEELHGIPIALMFAIDRTSRIARVPNGPGVVLAHVDFVLGGIITEQCDASLKREGRIDFALISALVLVLIIRIVVRTFGAACILERITFLLASVQVVFGGILAQGGDAVRKNLLRVLFTLIVTTQRAGGPATVAECTGVGLARIFIFVRGVGGKRRHAIFKKLAGIIAALIVAVYGAPFVASIPECVCLVFAYVYFVLGRILPKARHTIVENDARVLLALIPTILGVVRVVRTSGTTGVAKSFCLILACISIIIGRVIGKIGQAFLKQGDCLLLTLVVAVIVSIGQRRYC